MAYEVDYIPVDGGEKSGDAIVLRFGNLNGQRSEQSIVVIDGGFKESGELLVEHISKYYGTDQVDLVISTHPDADHASGLLVILEKLKVGGLLIHKPWDHAADIKNFFKNKSITVSGLEKSIEKSLQHASDLEDLAIKKNIPVYEPFQGLKLGGELIHVLGPSNDYYESLLPSFRSTPQPKAEFDILAQLKKAAGEAVNWIQDHIGIDLLNNDEDTTSPENNSSTIILFTIGDHKLLFTGDAGKTALLNATAYADSLGINLADLRFLDVPHHGSKRNLNSKILKRIKGGTAFVSASKDSKKHPARKVTNALQKHGVAVFVTRGGSLLHHNGGNGRGWFNATPEPFHALVEE